MKTHLITVVHGPAEVFAASFLRLFSSTPAKFDSIVVVDNHWPLNKEANTKSIAVVAEAVGAKLVKPEGGNIGGHQGSNFGISHIQSEADDLILGFDYDSWPVTPGWCEALVCGMKNSNFDSISLLHSDIKEIHDQRKTKWITSVCGGVRVGKLVHPEMFNLTIWRAAWLKAHPLVGHGFYGHVESLTHGYNNHGYTLDYLEGHHPIPCSATYHEWKRSHAGGNFKENFDVWCKQKGLL